MPNIYISPHIKIGYSFLALTILMLIGLILGLFGVSYGAEIIITPEPEEIDVNFIISVQTMATDDKENDDFINGQILETIQEAQEKGTPKATVSIEDYAEGEIILTNNTWSPINFMATTRFASPTGLIFRAINRITIPTRGETAVLVRADKMGTAYEISPTTFTLPGLVNSRLKDNIQAESKASMAGGLKKTGVVMQSDIDSIKKQLEEKLYNTALAKIQKEMLEANLKIIIQSNILEEKCDAKADDEKAEFTVSTKMKMGAVVFQEKELLAIAIKKLQEKIPPGKVLTAYEPNSLSSRLTKYDLDNQQATLEVQFRGYTIITLENKILEKTHFRELTADEVKNYLKDFKEIKETRVKLWPPFLKKIPASLDKIKTRIIGQ